jgi:hypothetical protein
VALSRLSLITSITIVLLSCIVEPLGLDGFVNEVSKGNSNGAGVDGGPIDFFENYSPELQWSDDGETTWKPLNKGQTIPINFNPPSSLTIRVENADDYDTGSIIWICDKSTAGYEATLTITAGVAPFDTVKIYPYSLTAKVEKNGQPYSTSIFIEVEDFL